MELCPRALEQGFRAAAWRELLVAQRLDIVPWMRMSAKRSSPSFVGGEGI